MKKKAIKIAASTAVAASAFVAVAPTQQADAATNVTQLVTDAQNAGTVLKWAISVEGSADYTTRPYAQYNAAKKAIAAAEAAATKLGTSEKLSVDAKLVDAKIQVKRAQAYIDAITSSEKIKADTAGLAAAIKTDDLAKVEAAYHKATGEYRKQAALLDRVYGQSTRDGIRNAVKPEIEKLVASVKNEVTVYMLAKAADVNAKAGKYEEASKNLSDAQAILDANVLKWETALQKSVNDVEASIPLSVTSITSDYKNTIVVKFSTKLNAGATTLPAGQFTFSNGLIVQSATVAADGKTVTLKTTDQTSNTTYALSYQGKATGKAFTTPASATDTTITINDTVEVFLANGKERGYTARFTKVDGTPYTGAVTIQLLDNDDTNISLTANQATVSKINGRTVVPTVTAGVVTYEASAVDGVVTFVLADGPDASAISVLPKVTKYENNVASFKYAGVTHFNPLATAGSVTGGNVTSVSKTVDGTFHLNNFIFNYDTNDQFFIRNQEVTAAQFFTALSKGDAINFDYKADKSLISTFRIDSDVTQNPSAALKIINANADLVVTHDQEAYRLIGTGQAGEIIEVYRTGGDFVATTNVDASGNWVINSLNLLAGPNNLVVTSRSTTETRSADLVDSDDTQYVTIHRGDYTPGVVLSDRDSSGTVSLNDVIEFDPKLGLNNNYSKVAANATITVWDNQFRSTVFTIAPTAVANEARITGVVSTTTGFNTSLAATNTLYVEAVTGVTNQDSLVWKPKSPTADNILSR